MQTNAARPLATTKSCLTPSRSRRLTERHERAGACGWALNDNARDAQTFNVDRTQNSSSVRPERGIVYAGLALVVLTGSFLCGCSSKTLDYTEVKRIDEQLTEIEIQTFLRIIRSIPDKQLPRFPLVFSLSTGWNQSRNLPVNVLLNEKKNLLNDHWSIDWLATHLDGNRPLKLALRKEEYTPQQFIGLALTIGVALSRGTLRDDQNLESILTKGAAAITRLERETRPFSSLSKEGMHYVLREAVWVTRVDRARHLKLVPIENVTLTAKHQKSLTEIFPAEFTTNPLDSIADLLEERGIPFEELPESGTDDQIEWSQHDAIVGTDSTSSE